MQQKTIEFRYEVKYLCKDKKLPVVLNGGKVRGILFNVDNIKHKLKRERSPQTNGKVERFHRTVGEKFYNRNFYLSLEGIKEGLKKYIEYYNKFRPHMGLNGLTPYEKLKELQGGILEDFKISNIYPLGRTFNAGIHKSDRESVAVTQFRDTTKLVNRLNKKIA